MKILIISQYHPPEMGAAAMRWNDYAQILSNLGHEVTVLSEIPNYPTGVIPDEYKNKYFVNEKDSKIILLLFEQPFGRMLDKPPFSVLGFTSLLCFQPYMEV
jgi:hypothetical protein